MKERKHTPGPWEAFGGHVLEHSRRIRICQCDELPGQSDMELNANAALIAAAPELLAALESLSEFADNHTPLHSGALVWTEARSAIAKATGGES